MEFELYQITLSVALGLLIIEMLTGTFFFIGLSMGAVAVATLHYYYLTIDISRDVLAFAAVSSVAFLTLRRLFANQRDMSTSDGDVNRY